MAINYTISYTFSPNTTIVSAQVNTNFSDNANTWTGLEAKTKSFAALQIDATPSVAADVVRKDYVDSLMPYRRPVLQYSSGTVVNIETGIDGTSGEARILFVDGTLRKDSTTGRINCNLGQNAVLSGSSQSGLRTGSQTANTWYSIYAVKVTDSSTNFVTVADTVLPLQTNFATLNSNFGTNGWIYLGTIRNGDGSAASNTIVKFIQAGNKTIFNNVSNNNVQKAHGVLMAGTNGATTLVYTYGAGTTALLIPNQIVIVDWLAQSSATAGTSGIRLNVQDASATWYLASTTNDNVATIAIVSNVSPVDGIALVTTGTPSLAYDIQLSGFIDGALGVGSNPLL